MYPKKTIETYNTSNPAVITIGTFDGVHIGHQKIIKRLVECAKLCGLRSVVLSFFPHPRMVLQKDANIKLITTIGERQAILESLGLDYLLVQKFTKSFSQLSAEDFVKTLLVDKLHAKKVIIGYDHRFGHGRTANIVDLKRFGKQYGFEVEEIPAQDINAISVSSTKIRHALAAGNISKANSYLGHSFTLTGTVIKGKGLGRTLGFPTANIQLNADYKLIPKRGVYIVRTQIDHLEVHGIMNIGTNPTVAGTSQSIEVHFFDLKKNLYNTSLTIEVLKRLRDEQKFDSLNALRTQLKYDAATAQHYFSKL